MFDANGDGYDDLTCHTSTGIIQISESHIVDKSKFACSPNNFNKYQVVKVSPGGSSRPLSRSVSSPVSLPVSLPVLPGARHGPKLLGQKQPINH